MKNTFGNSLDVWWDFAAKLYCDLALRPVFRLRSRFPSSQHFPIRRALIGNLPYPPEDLL